MNKRIRNRYNSKNRNIILNHIQTNINIYIVILTLFVVGLFIGVILVNNLSDSQTQTINEYITNSIDSLKKTNKLYKTPMLKQSLIKNMIIIFIIWAFGLTFFGKNLLYLVTFGLGLTFGYVFSAIMIHFSIRQSLLFFITAIFLQNIIRIPTIIFLCVEGIKCQNDFINQKNTSRIKYIIIKYTSYAILGTILLFISSILEVYISDSLLVHVTKYL